MKITLLAVNSSYTHTNLAVRYLAYSLKQQGIENTILEFNSKDKHDNILRELYIAKSDIYAFSVYIWNRDEMLLLAKELKSLLPECRIILGGPEVSFEAEDFFTKHPYITTVITGEGEGIIPEVCLNIENYVGKTVKGLQNRELFRSSPILYDIYPSKGDILYYESSRGCPHRCSYCLSSLTDGVYSKTAEKTLEDLLCFEKLEHKPRIIKFVDRTFNYDLERAKRIWHELRSDKYTLNYHFEICADTLDEECFEILAEMPKGKIQLEAGIQSTNPDTLMEVNRKTDNRRAIANLTRLKKSDNIHIHADLIVGLAYEDMQSFRHSFDETIGCCHKLQVGFLKLLRGSSVRRADKLHGYIYSPKAPYTVLANNYMSFEEIHLLKRCAEVIDRIYSSDRFVYTCEYILNNSPSPFDFFITLTNKLSRDVEKISQHELRLILHDHLKESFKDADVLSRLALDTLIWENKKPPECLCEYFTEEGKDIYRLTFDPKRVYRIDRSAHIIL